ncbi:hypothetical protein N0V93_006848 [Gnomoniopsis smithogilvyi]|uniref:Queuine tRNA-ribosyltransferase accessory subunit 2 n=1 Tax=Gnomoniopsis smithogilvyi TaxID=1191159 RepID=A0A9W8YRI5_9PEZI|nr:hypothetical protein N0V93_006848 [Gnomoniopsis smithogilvyi]
MSQDKEAEGMRFEILKAVGGNGASARLGRLTLPQRHTVDTPNFFAVTSRGAVPHLTPDTSARYESFPGVYMAMEDLVEKSQKVVTKIPAAAKIPAPDGKHLHAFAGLPSSNITVLGPRRTPAVKASIGNSDKYIQMFTSNGFQPLTNTEYITIIDTLKPDIAIPLADMNYSAMNTPGGKAMRRMCERTEDWMAQLHATLNVDELRKSNTSIFAPTLPAPYSMQWQYLQRLSEDMVDSLSGLAVYDVDMLPDLVELPSLLPLARLSIDAPEDPHEILRQVSLGVDVFLLPFINAVSDAGVAMTFTFPPSPSPSQATLHGTSLLPLGDDLTSATNATSLEPLLKECTCYACSSHHRAYLHHLLNAREMLAWTLLQIHNHHVITSFFAGIRASLALGKEKFQEDYREFLKRYEPSLPEGTGTRPRARGYHFKSEFMDGKRNESTWRILQDGPGQMQAGGKAKIEALKEKVERDQIEPEDVVMAENNL